MQINDQKNCAKFGQLGQLGLGLSMWGAAWCSWILWVSAAFAAHRFLGNHRPCAPNYDISDGTMCKACIKLAYPMKLCLVAIQSKIRYKKQFDDISRSAINHSTTEFPACSWPLQGERSTLGTSLGRVAAGGTGGRCWSFEETCKKTEGGSSTIDLMFALLIFLRISIAYLYHDLIDGFHLILDLFTVL